MGWLSGVVLAIGMIAGCGRINFDPLSDPLADAPVSLIDNAPDDGVDAEPIDAALCTMTRPPACSGCSTAVMCSYTGSCCTCTGAIWSCTTESVDVRCPMVVPGGGQSCPLLDEGLQCNYCPGGEKRGCFGGSWGIVIGTCAG